jgi:hypothetical protein
MRISLIILLLCSILNTRAQTTEEAKIEILSNDVNQSFFSFGPAYTLFFADYNTSIFTLGLNGHFYAPRFSLVTDAKYHVWDRLGYSTEFTGDIASIEMPKPSRSLSLVPTLNLINFEKEQDVRVVVWSRSSGKSTYYRYVDVRANVGHRIGLSAGLQLGSTFYFMQHLSVVGTAQDGTEYPLGNGGIGHQDLSSCLNYGVMKLGLSYVNSKQVTIDTKWGKKSTNHLVQVYANALLPFYQDMDDVYFRYDDSFNNEVLLQMSIQSDINFRETGWVVGVNAHGMHKFNLDYSVEFGMLPGPKQKFVSDTYLDITFRFNWVKMVNKDQLVDPQVN